MATTVILPKQGQSVETCIITEWYKNKGDKVEKGDLLFAYETDKASFEEEAQVAGTLIEVFCEAGDEVAVLSDVAVIGEPGEKVAAPASGVKQEAETPAAPVQKEVQLEMAVETVTEAAGDSSPTTEGRIRISPRAKKMATVQGIAIEGLAGSGPNGRIIVRDIEAAIASPAAVAAATTPEPVIKETVPPPAEKVEPAPPAPHPAAAAAPTPTAASGDDSEDKPLSNIRKLIAGAMHASLQNSAQLTHHLSADSRKILSLRSKVKKMQDEGYQHNITLNDMVCYSVIRGLKKHMDANVHFLGESIRYFNKVHLGVAVDTDRGLMVPVIRNADDLSLPGLSAQIKAVADACRSGKIDPDLLQPDAATFTVSNLGAYGVEMFTPVINLPQAGILGVNTIVQRPAQLEGGAFGFVPFMGLSLTYDHRAIDGGPATLFLSEIKNEIENFNHDLIKE